MVITNVSKGTELASNAKLAKSFFSRAIGLLGRRRLPTGGGLILEPCSSVHTAFMLFSIDLAYVKNDGTVIKTVPALKPFRVSAAFRGARYAVELPAGVLAATQTTPGDQLSFS